MLGQEIRDFLDAQRLGYVATASPDGIPNISPKGTIIAWGDGLAFADIRSPDTVANLRANPRIEINVIDPVSRRGYLFAGEASKESDGGVFEEIRSYYVARGVKSPIRAIVLVRLDRISEVTSPLYDLGFTEDEIRSRWRRHFAGL